MNQLDTEQLLQYIQEYRDKLRRYGLMYGGTLNGVEAIWHTLDDVEAFARGEAPNERHRQAYHIVAEKYRCGSATLGSKLNRDMGSNPESCTELCNRLQEVTDLCNAEVKQWVVHCKKQPYDVYVGRGRDSHWGNPFSHQEGTQATWKVDSREEAIARYREWVMRQPELIERIKRELKGKVLGCWCHPKACHGDVLAEIANGEA